MTGIPDAVMEAAWAKWRSARTLHPDFEAITEVAFKAGFAAAEGPWREHLATQVEAGMKKPKSIFDDETIDANDGKREAARIVRGTNE